MSDDESSLAHHFLEARPHIDAVLRHVSRRYRLGVDEAEELASRVRERLIEDDYRVLRAFQGRSQFRTYLTTVVTRLFLDERVRLWGKWRPSSEAVRLGPTAVALERALTRDRLRLDEAIATLRGADSSLTDELLHDLAARLPVRAPHRWQVDDSLLALVPSPEAGADHRVAEAEARAHWDAARETLASVLRALTPRERLLVRLRYLEGCRVAAIAGVIGVDQKPLYRQFEQILARLRRELAAAGLSQAAMAELLSAGMPDEPETNVGVPSIASVLLDDDRERPGAADGQRGDRRART